MAIVIKDNVKKYPSGGDVIAYINAFAYFTTIVDFKIDDALMFGMDGLKGGTKKDFFKQLLSIPIKVDQLNTAEITVLNIIRQHVSPNPHRKICGSDDPTNENVNLELIRQNPKNIYKYETRANLGFNVTCKVNKIECVISTTNGPVPMVPVFDLNLLGVVSNWVAYSNIFTNFNSAPTGFEYGYTLKFKNKKNTVVETLEFTHTF